MSEENKSQKKVKDSSTKIIEEILNQFEKNVIFNDDELVYEEDNFIAAEARKNYEELTKKKEKN